MPRKSIDILESTVEVLEASLWEQNTELVKKQTALEVLNTDISEAETEIETLNDMLVDLRAVQAKVAPA